MFSYALLALALIPVSFAQMTHNITVGANGALAFDPMSISAAVGDIVQFVFVAKNHTATQSSFASPCSKLIGADGVSLSGFDSGFQPVVGNHRLSSFIVGTNEPLWFYCRQTGHCSQGMVFAINPPSTGNTFENFVANALASSSQSTDATSASTTPSSTTFQPPASSTLSTDSTTSTPAPSVVTVTQTIVVGTSSWTTVYGSSPGSPDPTPNPSPVVHTIKVGDGGALTFSPSNITAQPRDTILFEFMDKNHTATQSTFDSPCMPIGISTGSAGFDSGFMPVTEGDLLPGLFNITVMDTNPIWVYCKQRNPNSHCGAGMTFSVNAVATGDKSFAAFQAAAKQQNGSTNGTDTTNKSGDAPLSTAVPAQPALLFSFVSSLVLLLAL